MSISDDYLNVLRKKGYLLVSRISIKEFSEIGNSIGTINQKIEVRLNDQSKQYPHCFKKVPFHTDHPKIPIVGWYCFAQDSLDGTSLLIDTSLLIEKLSEAELQVMTKIQLRVFFRESTCSLFKRNPYCFYWLPMVINEFLDNATIPEKACLSKISSLIENEDQIEIRLKPGDALFVDNNRMLHGREEISELSERYLLRAYIV